MCKIRMDGDRVVTTIFDLAPPPTDETKQVQINFQGMGDAVVTSNDGQIECDPFGVLVACLARVSVLQELLITVAVTAGYLLNGFLSESCQLSGNQCIGPPIGIRE